MKYIGYVVLGMFVLVLLAFGAAGVMLATLDPNDYKDQITKAVHDSTGRTLTLDGDISLSYFPVFGFSVSKARLSNPESFKGGEFAAIDELQAGVKILPLFSRSIELDSIHLVKPVINVIKLANGTTNLSFDVAAKSDTKNDAADENKKEAGEKFSLSSGEIKISDATVNYADKSSGASYVISPFNFSMSSFALGEKSSIDFDAVIKNAETKLSASGAMDVLINKDASNILVSNASSNIDLMNPSLSKAITVNAKSDKMSLDMKSQTAQLEGTRVSWDGTDIDIKGSYGWGTKTDAKFSVSANTVDLDKILAIVAPQTQKKLGDAKPAASSGAKGAKETALPVGMLQNISANGTMKVGTIKVYGMTFTDLEAHVKGTNGVLDFNPVTMNLYDGKLSATSHLDARNGTLKVSKKGTVENVALGGMLKDYLGEEYITGRANINFDIQSTGNTMQAVMRSMGGNVGFKVGEGYINHWQLSQRINQAVAFFNSGKLDENADDQIKFTTMGGTFQGQNGVFRNSDLTLIGPKMHVLGNGSVDLRQQNVNYTARVGLGDDPEKFTKEKHLPVTMSGPFSNLRYGIDVQSMVMEQAGEKIEEKKQELIGKMFEKLGGQKVAPKSDAPVTSESPSAETSAPDAVGGDSTATPVQPTPKKDNNPALKFLENVLDAPSTKQ